jgi:hypothetical protein
MATRKIELALYNLENDLSETNNVAAQYPEVVQRLQALADRCRDDLGDSAVRRTGANIRLPGRTAAVPTPQPQEGPIILHASEAAVHGATVRYEPQPHKNTIGFWTKVEDWVSWDFQVPTPGAFLVEILQGCGKGSGGSAVEFVVGAQMLSVTVEETGGFQNFVSRHIGQFTFDKPGRYTLSVKPRTKPGLAVMDLRAVTLWPPEK